MLSREAIAAVPRGSEDYEVGLDGVILVTVGQDGATLVGCGRRLVAWVETHIGDFRSRAQAEVWACEVLVRDVSAGSR